MRLGLFAVCGLVLCVLRSTKGAETFPYRAYVTSDDVYVRSGPGKNYYPTGKLQASSMVEIYRHDPGGWCVIRPPEGSFSWVSARYLKLGEDGLAQVVGDRVAARVGSAFSDIRDKIYVQLHRGETVEVLDSRELNTSEGDKWYKIMPPSGEFRWISGKYIDSEYDNRGTRKAGANDSPLLNPTRQVTPTLQPLTPTLQPEILPREFSPNESNTQPNPRWLQTKSTAQTSSRWASQPAEPLRLETAEIEPSTDLRSVDQNRNRPFRQLSPKDFEAELDTLDLELSVMLAEEPTVWTFKRLDHRSQSLLAQADTALEKGKARRLVKKIDQAADIKSRYDLLAKVQEKTEKTNRLLTTLRRDRSQADDDRIDDRYDGTGRLHRVVSRKVGAPRYALVDESDEIECYVTPAPGVRLEYFVGQRVGVSGVRGYMVKQKAPHVTAKRVDPLESRIR